MYDFTNQFSLNVIINSRRVTEYHHHDGNTYIEGRKGTEYELELVNDSFERVLMVPSVDGLSVVDGEEAGLDSGGYVVGPRSRARIPGWKLDDREAAKFVFDNAKDSYTKRSGKGTRNVGALGLLVFREKTPGPAYAVGHQKDRGAAPWHNPWYGSSGHFGIPTNDTYVSHDVSTTNSTLSAADWQKVGDSLQQQNEVGTGFGNPTGFKTQEVNFEKRDPRNPDAMLALYYDSAKGLEKRGIIMDYRTKPQPHPFPKYSSSQKGCIPPPGWRENADRDDIIEDLLGRLNSEGEKDKMYEMLAKVRTEDLEDAFDTFLKALRD